MDAEARVLADGRLISSIDEAALLEFADHCGTSLKTCERTGGLTRTGRWTSGVPVNHSDPWFSMTYRRVR